METQDLVSMRLPIDPNSQPPNVLHEIVIERFADRSVEAVAADYLRHWDSIRNDRLREFAQAVAARRTPRGIVIDQLNADLYVAWVENAVPSSAESPQLTEFELTHAWFMQEPNAEVYNLPAVDQYFEFCCAFPSLRCEPPPASSFFWGTLMGPAELFEGELAKVDGGKWAGAFEVYVGDAGDTLLLARDGSLGWLLHETRQIIEYADDFSVVLDNLLRDGSLGCIY